MKSNFLELTTMPKKCSVGHIVEVVTGSALMSPIINAEICRYPPELTVDKKWRLSPLCEVIVHDVETTTASKLKSALKEMKEGFMILHHLVVLVLMVVTGVVVGRSSPDLRLLYDEDLPNSRVVNVSTLLGNINQPVGVATGLYNDQEGVFVSSFASHQVIFVNTEGRCADSFSCEVPLSIGSGEPGRLDGSYDVASFTHPSRMVYVHSLGRLLITDRGEGFIRYVDFGSSSVKTFLTSSGEPIDILSNSVAMNNPEVDITFHRNHIYLSDSFYVYNLTGNTGLLQDAFDKGVLNKYQSLRDWQEENDYDVRNTRTYIQSITVNANTEELYVAFTYARNAIVIVPLESASASDIRLLYSDGVKYNIPSTYPRPVNGLLSRALSSGYAIITFPMHLYYDDTEDVLYWIEVFAHLSGGTHIGALGAVALRRLNLKSSQVDYYAGDTKTYIAIIGCRTGYLDGAAAEAKFSYPMSIAYSGNQGGVGSQFFITDYDNSAVRRVFTFIDTPLPSAAPTISMSPTVMPTSSSPSANPFLSPSPTHSTPTRQPSMLPSHAISPTGGSDDEQDADTHEPSASPAHMPKATIPKKKHPPRIVPSVPGHHKNASTLTIGFIVIDSNRMSRDLQVFTVAMLMVMALGVIVKRVHQTAPSSNSELDITSTYQSPRRDTSRKNDGALC